MLNWKNLNILFCFLFGLIIMNSNYLSPYNFSCQHNDISPPVRALLYLLRNSSSAQLRLHDHYNGGRISMSTDGSAYTVLSQSAVQYYKKINDVYTLIDKISPLCIQNTRVSNCLNSRQWMSSDGKRVFYIHNSSVNILKVYQLQNSTLQYLQDINYPNSLSAGALGRSSEGGAVQAKQDFILLSDTAYLQMYKFDSTVQQYQRIFYYDYSAPAPQPSRKCTCSTDGKYIACIAATGNFNLILFTFDGTTYTSTTPTVASANSASLIVWGLAVQQYNSSAYNLIIRFSNGAVYITEYFLLINSVISSAQTVDRANGNYFYMSQNARYIVAFTTLNQIKLYELDQSLGQYILSHTFGIVVSIINLFVSQDATLILFNTNNGYLDAPASMYFKCHLTNCLSCRILGQCATCADSFTLASNHTCSCNSTQTLINSTCITCIIPHCSSCKVINICSACLQNFILANNSCVCPSGSTISQLDGSCVLCNVDNCYRCDQNNTCAFAMPKQAVVAQEEMSKGSAAALGVGVVLFVFLGAAVVYLFIRLKKMGSILEKVQMATITSNEGEVQRNSFVQLNSSLETKQNKEQDQSKSFPRQRRRKLRNIEASQEQKLTVQIINDKS